eukprot:jgi/Mesen1/6646/ME000340S05808
MVEAVETHVRKILSPYGWNLFVNDSSTGVRRKKLDCAKLCGYSAWKRRGLISSMVSLASSNSWGLGGRPSSSYAVASPLGSECSWKRFSKMSPMDIRELSSLGIFSRRTLCAAGIDYMGTGGTNEDMLAKLQGEGILKSEVVIDTMKTVDRKYFVHYSAHPYFDMPLPVGYAATISAPHMHAYCLELLASHLKPGMRALDVGSGTGYLTACMAAMVGPEGRAVGVEHIPELVEGAVGDVKNVTDVAPLLEKGVLTFHVADGRQGWAQAAPFDAIHVGAAAEETPQALIDQLKPGGRMVIPVGGDSQQLLVIDKTEDGSCLEQSKASVRYVPLTSKENQLYQ